MHKNVYTFVAYVQAHRTFMVCAFGPSNIILSKRLNAYDFIYMNQELLIV